MAPEGVDVANYQPANFPTAGLAFVFVKATEGRTYTNPKHAAQVAHARAAGLVVGHYHFVRPGPMGAQADYFLTRARPRAGDMLCLDWEDPGVSGAEKDEFLHAVQDAAPGHRLVLYANRDFWLHRDRTSFCADGLWIADPSAPRGRPRVGHPWVFHQYAIKGGMDRNVSSFTSTAALRAWAAGTEEDPMAGMSRAEIAGAVWRTDNVLPAGSTEPNSKNTAWTAQTYLTRTFENTTRLLTQVAAQGAAITALAQQLGTGRDVDTIMSAVREAVADATVRVHVDVTGAEDDDEAGAGDAAGTGQEG